MDADEQQLATAVGERVRTHRLQRGWTLDELAAASGVSRRTVVNVEKASTNPSVGVLLKLADAVGVSLAALVEAPAAAAITVTRQGGGKALWTGEHGGRGLLAVTSSSALGIVETWDWTLQPSERHDSEPHRPGTREHIRVLEGAVRIDVADTHAVLQVGDIAAYDADVVHGYRCASDSPAVFALTVIEPHAPGPAGAHPHA